MPDSVFSESYMKLLRVTIAVELSKQTSGRRMTNEDVAEFIWALKTQRSASEVRFT